MNQVSLTTSEVNRLVGIFVSFAIIVALIILAARNEALSDRPVSTVLQAISVAVTLATLCFAVLTRLPWTRDLPARIMDRPIVHGVWHGKIHTNHGVTPGGALRPIEIVLVIRQSYLALSIESFTPSQEAESVIEAIVRSAKTEATKLYYVYELRRTYQGENKLTLGSGELKLMDSGRRLKGHYFTNSPTHGEIDLELFSRDCDSVDCFDAAKKFILQRKQSASSLYSKRNG